MGFVNIPVSALMDRYQDRLTRGLADAGQIVVDEVRRTITEDPKTGTHWPGLPYRSSAPGETPRYQFGGLSAGLVVVAEEDKATVTSWAPYSARLEYGFVGVDGMGRTYDQGARPFMRPSLVVKYEDIVTVIGKSLSGK